ncbi:MULTISPECIES: formyl transferase [Ensifer]|uniref:phosphoribosylglycinamide formyltransferase 1 n=1 Tax=Ensifer adhaerens TaxID=106592 RepID=A0ABY8HK27_ENSAD|nr:MULTISPECIES: formyl transferase [Ensifer]ANK72740.1 formyl transferase [Ensifer adhaerens]KDP76312.1 formyl transferase [Ensifer adhaerens]KQX32882.1 formyl transferase [Ensifer sp. Root423]KQZ58448.1 formyl transferase [Ensifer sp. Root558]MBD9540485.1 formyl transferase [Ensifer sp. ENS04]
MTDIASQNQAAGGRPGRVVVVTAGGENPWIMINAFSAHFADVAVVEEQPESKGLFLRRRARKLGWLTALGQLATMIASRFGKRFTRKRADEIFATYKVSGKPDPSIPVKSIASINDTDAIAQVRALKPDVVFLISCRMLKAETLAAFPCPVLNFHAGINPAYRGLMGGYWAQVNNDLENFGATVHLVDAGVDTGGVLYQSRQKPAPHDTMHTYPLLQTAASTDIAIAAVGDALAGKLQVIDVAGPSRQWYHPPIWTWIWNGLKRGIW